MNYPTPCCVSYIVDTTNSLPPRHGSIIHPADHVSKSKYNIPLPLRNLQENTGVGHKMQQLSFLQLAHQQRSDNVEVSPKLPLESEQSARIVFHADQHALSQRTDYQEMGEGKQCPPHLHRIGAHSAFGLSTTKDCSTSVSSQLPFVFVRRPSRMRCGWRIRSERASDVLIIIHWAC